MHWIISLLVLNAIKASFLILASLFCHLLRLFEVLLDLYLLAGPALDELNTEAEVPLGAPHCVPDLVPVPRPGQRQQLLGPGVRSQEGRSAEGQP